MSSKDFEIFLNGIGGLENGWTCWPNEITNPIKYRMFEICSWIGYSDHNNPFRVIINKRKFFAIGDGWLKLIQELIIDLINIGWDKNIVSVRQVKGSLRFYINNGTNDMFQIIGEYEKRSATVCEHCGESGIKYEFFETNVFCRKHIKL